MHAGFVASMDDENRGAGKKRKGKGKCKSSSTLTHFCFAADFLRAPDHKYRESHDRKEISSSILFYQKYPFGKLFSKIIFKSSSAFCYFLKFR